MSEFTQFCAAEVRANAAALCKSWLERLEDLLPVSRRDVFPTNALLDHMPETMEELAGYIDEENSSDVIVASAVTEKARELGRLRFGQDASIHQVLQEYDLLATVLGDFITECSQSTKAPRPSVADTLGVLGRVHRCIRVLTQASVDAFTACYAEMINEQQETLRAFNRMVTHELRNPMSTIDLVAHLLGDKELDPERRKRMFTSLKSAVSKMSQTLRELETLSETSDSGQSTPTQQTVLLGPLTAEVFESLSGMAAEKGVELRADESFPEIHSVLHRIEMILVNLVANGIKYSDPDKADRFVAVEAVDSDVGAAFRVRDNGIGIPEEKQEAVFGRFYRGHRTRDEELETDGSGLGLSIVAECVRGIGGTVSLSSQEGVGSEFIVTLPPSPES